METVVSGNVAVMEAVPDFAVVLRLIRTAVGVTWSITTLGGLESSKYWKTVVTLGSIVVRTTGTESEPKSSGLGLSKPEFAIVRVNWLPEHVYVTRSTVPLLSESM